MIKTLKLSNFRSLGEDVELSLGNLNFLVGANGAGKSNILRSLSFVREAMRIGLPGAVTTANGIGSVRRHSGGHPRNARIELELQLDGGPARYGFELTGDSVEEYRVKAEWVEVGLGERGIRYEVKEGVFTGPENLRPNLDGQSLALTALGGDARLRPLWEFLANSMVYSINPAALRVPQKFSSETPMQSQGENWISILHNQEGEPWIKDLEAALKKLTGDLDHVKVTKAASFLVAEFRHLGASEKTEKWFPAELESDGTLRVAGILTALLQLPALPVIGVEEPEQTVHPGAIPLLYDYLKEASGRSQVIVTTHSPIFLNYVKLEDCRVFVVGRGDNGTQVQPLSEAQRESVKKKLLSLGDLMLSGDLQLDLEFESGE
jgi:predicted ATPase